MKKDKIEIRINIIVQEILKELNSLGINNVKFLHKGDVFLETYRDKYIIEINEKIDSLFFDYVGKSRITDIDYVGKSRITDKLFYSVNKVFYRKIKLEKIK